MNLATRLILLLTVTILPVGMVSAQQTETAATTTVATNTAATGTSTVASTETAREEEREGSVRRQLEAVLQRQPSRVTTILALEPELLSNDSFLAGYPEVARFVAQHPEVRSNPREYVAGLWLPPERKQDPADVISVIGVIIGVALAFIWLVRTIIDQRRWSRLSRTQTEVHNKILDRFSSGEELLQYIKSPAGTKFLESAPIPLHERSTLNAPMPRILLSVQLGVIIAFAGLGMLLVSFRLEKEASSAMFAMGAIAFCVGAGFIAAAAVSMYVSRRFFGGESSSSAALENSELMR